ncbi:VCBS repeat-containing protein [soil metagenome]
MNDNLHPHWRIVPWLLCSAVLVSGALLASATWAFAVRDSKPSNSGSRQQDTTEASSEAVHKMCAACHAYPAPDTFPRSAWRKEVKQGFDFFLADPSLRFPYPSLESVVRYYENRAPSSLPAPSRAPNAPARVRFEPEAVPSTKGTGAPGAAYVGLVHLFHKDKLDILVCDAINKQILVLSPYESSPAWKVIASGFTSAHAEVVDLDGDGINDVLLACLGHFYATDDFVGSVVWLKGAKDHTFAPQVLLDGIGRVADVRAAHFFGTSKFDLVVAEFGWHQKGGILLLENQTTDWSKPQFKSHLVDNRHGATHVPVADLNGDGKPDFVALLSQEHESVIAFLNEGGGKFRKELIYAAPSPSFGCHGIQVVDLDKDGSLDVILANGDSLDAPFILKPYHGLTWLKNLGSYPFTPQRLTDCYGAGSPITADFDGDGRLDIAIVSFLPGDSFPTRVADRLDSVALLMQVEKGKFVRQSVETGICDHLTCAAGDLNGNGKPDLVIGNYVRGGQPGSPITVLRNVTEMPKRTASSKP